MFWGASLDQNDRPRKLVFRSMEPHRKDLERDEVAQQLANLDTGRLLQSEFGAGEVAQLAKPDIWLQLQPEFEASCVTLGGEASGPVCFRMRFRGL